jgi:hypothetical protein
MLPSVELECEVSPPNIGRREQRGDSRAHGNADNQTLPAEGCAADAGGAGSVELGEEMGVGGNSERKNALQRLKTGAKECDLVL